MTVCPQCGIAVKETDNECPTCKILFSKWKERENNVATGNMSRYAALATATSSGFNWTILVIVCVVLVGVFYLMGHSTGAVD